MKIWFISDTHGRHWDLKIPNVDMVIHSGDTTNWNILYRNEEEFRYFLKWYKSLEIKHKIFIAGNHDMSLYDQSSFYNKYNFKDDDIIYLQDDRVEIESLIIHGTPWTPKFGDWFFMKDRHKLKQKVWDHVDYCDILITHGPPKGVMDWAKDRYGRWENCGDKSLFSKIYEMKPLINCFGHIHNNHDHINNGITFLNDTHFINASCVTDGEIETGKLNHGFIVDIDTLTKEIINISLNK